MSPAQPLARRLPALALCAVAAALLTACATGPAEPTASQRPETVLAVTEAAELIRFNAGAPQQISQRLPLRGLPAGQTLLGIDFRVARGVLFAVTSGGRLATINTSTGQLTLVGNTVVPLQGQRFGVDFNPVADRVRLVSDSGLNLRLHPDTGVVAATDPALAWAPGQAGAGTPPRLAAAGYTYNKSNDKLTTNYALDIGSGALLTQGTHEAVQPAVSPNSGLLYRVGPLGTGALEDASMDIADTDNSALAALRQGGRTRLHRIDLATGRATLLGTVDKGQALWGLAIEP